MTQRLLFGFKGLGHQIGQTVPFCVGLRQYHSNKLYTLYRPKLYVKLVLGSSCQNQIAFSSIRAALNSQWFTQPPPRYNLPCRNYSSQSPRLDPNKESRRKKLTLATYISGAIGIVLLSAIGIRFYGRLKRRASGAEELKVEEYSFGRRAWLYKYRGYVFSDMFLGYLRDIHTFDVREDDIWVVTFPKSGTTWVQEIVYLLMNDIDTEKASKTTLDLRFPYFEFPMPGIAAIAKMPSPRLIKSHLPPSMLPNQMKSKKPKTIYVARNPKDVAVSFFVFAIKFLNMVPFNGSHEDYYRLFLNDKVAYGPWWKHVSEGWKLKDDDNFLFLFYEDLQTDPGKCVKDMAEFLGKSVTDEQVEVIVKHCSFNNMKNNNTVNYEWLKDSGFASKDVSFMRKGKVGDWKNHIPEDIAKQFDEMVATKLPGDMCGYIRDNLPEQ